MAASHFGHWGDLAICPNLFFRGDRTAGIKISKQRYETVTLELSKNLKKLFFSLRMVKKLQETYSFESS